MPAPAEAAVAARLAVEYVSWLRQHGTARTPTPPGCLQARAGERGHASKGTQSHA